MAAVTENKNSNVDVYNINIEIVQFTTAATGDTYLVKRLKNVDGAFANQQSTDGEEIQCSWALESNGQPKITLAYDGGGGLTGTLTIYGRP